MKLRNKFTVLFVALIMSCLPCISLAADGASASPSLGGVAGNLFDVGLNVQSILKSVGLIAGISLILASIVQYTKYRKNPIVVRLGSVVFTFCIGVCLILLSFVPMSAG